MQDQKTGYIKRPDGLPDDYGRIAIIQKNGTQLFLWARTIEKAMPDGTKKLLIEEFVPDE